MLQAEGACSTVVLVGRLQAVPVPQQRAHRLPQAVLVGLLGSVVEEGVGHKARVSSVLYVLQEENGAAIKVMPTTGGNEAGNTTTVKENQNAKGLRVNTAPPTPLVSSGSGSCQNRTNTKEVIR